MTSLFLKSRPAYHIARCALLAIVGTLTACGGLPEKKDETATWSGDKLYVQAQEALESHDWIRCAEYFEKMEGRDPFGSRAPQAQINVAYCQWKNNEPQAAEQAVDRFIRLHPDHPQLAYAYYLKGLLNFKDELGLLGQLSAQDLSERDPEALRRAYDAFKVIATRYPSSRYAPDAMQRMRYIVNALAAHEVHAAQYYYERGAYLAAINRAKHVLTEYPNTPAIPKALSLMQKAYQALGTPELAADAKRVLKATDSKRVP